MYLFCFLKPDKRSPAVNQKRAVEVCQKLGCGYLNLSEKDPTCDCEPSTEYFLAFKNRKKEAIKDEEDQIRTDEN